MNKLSILCIGATAMLLAGCSNEAQSPADGNEGVASFSVIVPEAIQSRAISDGSTANDLHYVVFDVDNNVVAEYTKADAFAISKLTNVQIRLVNGQTYKVAFWAQNTNAPYSCRDGKITVSYAEADCGANSELRDAFFKVYGPFTFSADWEPGTIKLSRPFAQVNVGTSDWDTASAHNAIPYNTGMNFTASVYSTLNLVDGSVANPVAVNFGLNGLPSDSELTITKADDTQATYKWIGMNYILVPTTDEVVATVTFTHDFNNGSIDFTQIPVKRNYRTNIVGNILTSSSDWAVVIDNKFVDDKNVETN